MDYVGRASILSFYPAIHGYWGKTKTSHLNVKFGVWVTLSTLFACLLQPCVIIRAVLDTGCYLMSYVTIGITFWKAQFITCRCDNRLGSLMDFFFFSSDCILWYRVYSSTAFPKPVIMYQNVFASAATVVMVEGCEWLFCFLQPAALQGGKMAGERKVGSVGLPVTGGVGGSYRVLTGRGFLGGGDGAVGCH